MRACGYVHEAPTGVRKAKPAGPAKARVEVEQQMSLELVATLASIGTLLVIAATAVAAFVQLRHLSGSNSISALTESREVLESAEFAAAQRFVASELPELLKDPAVRHELLTANPLTERLTAIVWLVPSASVSTVPSTI